MPCSFLRSVSGFAAVPVAVRLAQSTAVSPVPVTSSIVSSLARPAASNFSFWKPVIAPALFPLPLTLSVLPMPLACEPPLSAPVTRTLPSRWTSLLFVVAPSPPVTEATVTFPSITRLFEAAPMDLPPVTAAAFARMFTMLPDASPAPSPPTTSCTALSIVTLLPCALPPAASV